MKTGTILGFVYLLVTGILLAVMPYILLVYLVYTVLSGVVAHLMVKREATVDIGVSVRSLLSDTWRNTVDARPLAQFRIVGRLFRVHILPVGVTVDGVDDYRIGVFGSLTMLFTAFLLYAFVLWLDGWPDVAPTSQGKLHHTSAQESDHGWAERIRREGRVSVSRVDDGSAASKAGLHCGDMIVGVDGKTTPSFFDVVRAISRSDRVTLCVERAGIRRELILQRDQPQDRPGVDRFGMVLGLSLRYGPDLLVRDVRFKSKPYVDGLRPGDRITTIPSVERLSDTMLRSGCKLGEFQAIRVEKAHRRPWGILNSMLNEFGEVRTIPATRMDDSWFDSLVFEHRFQRYKPTPYESVQLAFSCLVYAVTPMPLEAKRLGVVRREDVRVASPNACLEALKHVSMLSMFFAFLFALFNAARSYSWVFLMALALYLILGRLLSLAVYDSALLGRARIVPFGELMNWWRL